MVFVESNIYGIVNAELLLGYMILHSVYCSPSMQLSRCMHMLYDTFSDYTHDTNIIAINVLVLANTY